MAYTRDDLTFFVSAANLAGYLEAQDKIIVQTDEELLEFIEQQYGYYRARVALGLLPIWSDQIGKALINEFARKEETRE